jgi:hypothetical protein
MSSRNYPFYHVKKRSLLAVAGCVWLAAGFNVARLGIISYTSMHSASAVQIALSLIVFSIFGLMFQKMSTKHTKRIRSYEDETKPFWFFFDIKAYCIMTFMMTGGIWLRSSGLVPNQFIAVFYTGLGCALAFAGAAFFKKFISFRPLAVSE